jgi:hypothetical protein
VAARAARLGGREARGSAAGQQRADQRRVGRPPCAWLVAMGLGGVSLRLLGLAGSSPSAACEPALGLQSTSAASSAAALPSALGWRAPPRPQRWTRPRGPPASGRQPCCRPKGLEGLAEGLALEGGLVEGGLHRVGRAVRCCRRLGGGRTGAREVAGRADGRAGACPRPAVHHLLRNARRMVRFGSWVLPTVGGRGPRGKAAAALQTGARRRHTHTHTYTRAPWRRQACIQVGRLVGRSVGRSVGCCCCCCSRMRRARSRAAGRRRHLCRTVGAQPAERRHALSAAAAAAAGNVQSSIPQSSQWGIPARAAINRGVQH